MTTQPTQSVIPEWTLGDRLRKARSQTGLTTREFAVEIGISQKTLTDCENDNRPPRKPVLMAWSMRTGVPMQWLQTGESPHDSPDPDGGETVPVVNLGGKSSKSRLAAVPSRAALITRGNEIVTPERRAA